MDRYVEGRFEDENGQKDVQDVFGVNTSNGSILVNVFTEPQVKNPHCKPGNKKDDSVRDLDFKPLANCPNDCAISANHYQGKQQREIFSFVECSGLYLATFLST